MVKKRRVSVLGSTGSIGRNTLKVLEQQGGTDRYDVVALTGGQNVGLLAEQARQFQAQFVAISDTADYQTLKDRLADTPTEILAGDDALIAVAQEETDWCMAAISGMAGVKVAFSALPSTKVMALATKECLVCAGQLFLQTAKRNSVQIIPVDSEHNAIYQVFDFNNPNTVKKLILTASGGPFRTWTREQMCRATLEDALAHPTWTMGRHITIDSATMFNKAMEMIEAQQLFSVDADAIDVVIHPESIIHSMVEYKDGSFLAQMGVSDMCIPITYALGWPDRLRNPAPSLNFKDCNTLTFEEPDRKRFRALDIACGIMKEKSNGGCVLNAAKEIAVEAFLRGKIRFLDIETMIESALSSIDYHRGDLDMDALIALDEETRSFVKQRINI